MKQFIIYYSRSHGVDDSEINHLLQTIVENIPVPRDIVSLSKHSADKPYDPGLVKKANLIVVGLEGSYSEDYSDDRMAIGKGCLTEIRTAISLGIPVVAIIKDGDEDGHFLHTVSEHDITVTNSETWKIGHAILNLHGAKEFTDSHDDFDEQYKEGHETFYPIAEEYQLDLGAAIDDQDELKSLFQIIYFGSKLWSSSPEHPPKSVFGLWKDNTENNPILLLRKRR